MMTIGDVLNHKLDNLLPAPTDYPEIWARAKAAGEYAAKVENAKLGPEGGRGLDCGFAWITMPGNIPFGRWAKKTGIASKGYPTGLQIWYSKVHSVPTQSVSVHEAACKAARDVLAQLLGTSMIAMGSRLD
jgi:hypothetical protein